MGQLNFAQDMPTTNELIEDLHSKGLAMRRGGAEHMMVHADANRDDEEEDNERRNRSKQDQSKMELDFLKNLPKKTKHRLVKRLKHLERHGAITALISVLFFVVVFLTIVSLNNVTKYVSIKISLVDRN